MNKKVLYLVKFDNTIAIDRFLFKLIKNLENILKNIK